MTSHLSRRRLLQASLAAAGSSLLAACGSSNPPQTPAQPAKKPDMNTQPQPQPAAPVRAGDNTLRIFACSGFAEDPIRVETGITRLSAAGFQVENRQAGYRRFQRFAGSDAERIADFQDIAAGKAAAPKVLMGLRGGYGAVRLLPHIDWGRLGAKMQERQTLLFGFSDVTAIQMALLAQTGHPSFAGPMLYSEFGKAQPSTYTMDSFIRATTAPQYDITVSAFQSSRVRPAEGMVWGGNLSVLASLAGSAYMPKVKGGILFIEDVAEQPYRIERMLHTLYLAGILQQQQALVLGDFRMGNIRDSYDAGYNLTSVAQSVSRAAGIPVLMNFPFGHITNKATFPLGARGRLSEADNGGYRITFSGYPTLNPAALNLSALLPPPPELENGIFGSAPAGNGNGTTTGSERDGEQ